MSRYSKERHRQLLSLFKIFSQVSFQKEEEKEQSKKNMRYGLSSLVAEGTVGVRNIAYLTE